MTKSAHSKARSEAESAAIPVSKPPLANLTESNRKRAGLTQSELARRAGVSPKTVAQIEETGAARWDAVARISRALNQPVSEWLHLAGHQVPQARIDDVLRERPPAMTLPFPRLDPQAFYDRVAARLKVHLSGLMCTCVISNAPLATEALYDQMKMILKGGIHHALLVPFPIGSSDIASQRPHLYQYYQNTYTWASELAAKLRGIDPCARKRVHVFSPDYPQGGATLVYTPIRANELRPTFTKYSANKNIEAKFEFGAYIRFEDSREDQWIDIHNGDDELAPRAREAFGPWHDFCSDIVGAWSVGKDNESIFAPKIPGWRLMPV